MRIFIGMGDALLVTFKADAGEFGTADQSGLNVTHPDPGSVQIGPQAKAELADKGLGCAIDIAAGVGPTTCR